MDSSQRLQGKTENVQFQQNGQLGVFKEPPTVELGDLDDTDFLQYRRAHRAQESSCDPDTQVGCSIAKDGNTIALGANVFSDGLNVVSRPDMLKRPDKYTWIEHAERDAIYTAARYGRSTKGCTMYVVASPAKPGICAECARAIVMSGISRVVCSYAGLDGDWWKDSCESGRKILEDGGVECVWVRE